MKQGRLLEKAVVLLATVQVLTGLPTPQGYLNMIYGSDTPDKDASTIPPPLMRESGRREKRYHHAAWNTFRYNRAPPPMVLRAYYPFPAPVWYRPFIPTVPDFFLDERIPARVFKKKDNDNRENLTFKDEPLKKEEPEKGKPTDDKKTKTLKEESLVIVDHVTHLPTTRSRNETKAPNYEVHDIAQEEDGHAEVFDFKEYNESLQRKPEQTEEPNIGKKEFVLVEHDTAMVDLEDKNSENEGDKKILPTEVRPKDGTIGENETGEENVDDLQKKTQETEQTVEPTQPVVIKKEPEIKEQPTVEDSQLKKEIQEKIIELEVDIEKPQPTEIKNEGEVEPTQSTENRDNGDERSVDKEEEPTQRTEIENQEIQDLPTVDEVRGQDLTDVEPSQSTEGKSQEELPQQRSGDEQEEGEDAVEPTEHTEIMKEGENGELPTGDEASSQAETEKNGNIQLPEQRSGDEQEIIGDGGEPIEATEIMKEGENGELPIGDEVETEKKENVEQRSADGDEVLEDTEKAIETQPLGIEDKDSVELPEQRSADTEIKEETEESKQKKNEELQTDVEEDQQRASSETPTTQETTEKTIEKYIETIDPIVDQDEVSERGVIEETGEEEKTNNDETTPRSSNIEEQVDDASRNDGSQKRGRSFEEAAVNDFREEPEKKLHPYVMHSFPDELLALHKEVLAEYSQPQLTNVIDSRMATEAPKNDSTGDAKKVEEGVEKIEDEGGDSSKREITTVEGEASTSGPLEISPGALIKLIPVIVHDLRNGSVTEAEKEALTRVFGKLWPHIENLANDTNVHVHELFDIDTEDKLNAFLGGLYNTSHDEEVNGGVEQMGRTKRQAGAVVKGLRDLLFSSQDDRVAQRNAEVQMRVDARRQSVGDTVRQYLSHREKIHLLHHQQKQMHYEKKRLHLEKKHLHHHLHHQLHHQHHHSLHHQPSHHESQHHQTQHHQSQHHQSQHHQSQHHESQHHQSQHHESEHHQSQHYQTQHHQSQHHKPQHHQSQHHKPQHHQSQHQKPPHHKPYHQSNLHGLFDSGSHEIWS